MGGSLLRAGPGWGRALRCWLGSARWGRPRAVRALAAGSGVWALRAGGSARVRTCGLGYWHWLLLRCARAVHTTVTRQHAHESGPSTQTGRVQTDTHTRQTTHKTDTESARLASAGRPPSNVKAASLACRRTRWRPSVERPLLHCLPDEAMRSESTWQWRATLQGRQRSPVQPCAAYQCARSRSPLAYRH